MYRTIKLIAQYRRAFKRDHPEEAGYGPVQLRSRYATAAEAPGRKRSHPLGPRYVPVGDVKRRKLRGSFLD